MAVAGVALVWWLAPGGGAGDAELVVPAQRSGNPPPLERGLPTTTVNPGARSPAEKLPPSVEELTELVRNVEFLPVEVFDAFLEERGHSPVAVAAVADLTGDAVLLRQAVAEHPGEWPLLVRLALLGTEADREGLRGVLLTEYPEIASTYYLAMRWRAGAHENPPFDQESARSDAELLIEASRYRDEPIIDPANTAEKRLALMSVGIAEHDTQVFAPFYSAAEQRLSVQALKSAGQIRHCLGESDDVELLTRVREATDTAAGHLFARSHNAGITFFAALALQRMALQDLDPAHSYGSEGGTVAAALAAIEADMREAFNSNTVEMESLSSAEAAAFFDRALVVGEFPAWLELWHSRGAPEREPPEAR